MRKILLTTLLFLSWSTASFANTKLSLMLDWFPNIDHLPIYVAQQEGYFSNNGIDLEIVVPSETADGLKLTATGNVDLAVSYQPQTIIAASQGLDLHVVTPLVAHPLTTLLYLEESGIQNPEDLEGKKIGYTVPGLMDKLLVAFAEKNGLKEYTPINVGFSILPALSSKQVAAVMGPFKTYETVTMAAHGYKTGYFDLEKYGIPDYEELIFVAGDDAYQNKKEALIGFKKAIKQAMLVIKNKPEHALKLYFTALPDIDPTIERAAFALTQPFYAYQQQSDAKKWQAFADFALQYKLIDNAVESKKLLQ